MERNKDENRWETCANPRGEGAPTQRIDDKSALYISILFAWVMEWYALFRIAQINSQHQMRVVMVSMAIAVVCAIALYRVLLLIPRRVSLLPVGFSRSGKGILLWGVVVCSAVGLSAAGVHRVLTEKNTMDIHYGRDDLLWNRLPGALVLAVCAGALCCLLYEIMEEEGAKRDKRNWKTFVCYFLAVIVHGTVLYAPNVFNNDIHHMTAALQSVYNTAYNVPFTAETTGIYGHYAIFLWPFLKVFGHTPQAIAIMIACVGGLTQVLLIYAIHHLIQSNAIRRAAALASILPIVTMYSRAYFQVYPLRILPPALILAYMAYCKKRNRLGKIEILGGYVVCGLGVTWVTDVGMVCALAYSAWICCVYWREKRVFSKGMLKVYLGCVLACIGDLACVVLIVNMYNMIICQYTRPVFSSVFFPFIGGSGFAEDLQLPLRWMNLSWIWVLALFFVCTVLGLSGTTVLGKRAKERPANDALFFCAVMGIGMSAYYMNRAAYFNLTIVMPMASVCMGIMVDRTRRLFRFDRNQKRMTLAQAIQRGVGIAIAAELAILSAGTVLTAGRSIEEHVNKGYYDMNSLVEVSRQVENTVPKDTYAVGYGTQEIYAQLGWNPQYHYRDVSDMFGYGTDAIVAEINSQDALLLCNDQGYLLDRDIGWQLVAQLDYYCYFIRNTAE